MSAPNDTDDTDRSPLLDRHVSFQPIPESHDDQAPPSPATMSSTDGVMPSAAAVEQAKAQQGQAEPAAEAPTPEMSEKSTPGPVATPAVPPVPTLPTPVPPPSSAVNTQPPTPAQRLPKADTNMSWGGPAGLHLRAHNDENLQIFRRALGINTHLGMPGTRSSTNLMLSPGAVEAGRRATPGGIYAAVLDAQRRKAWAYAALSILIYVCHFGQIIIGAGLTALGPAAGDHALSITALGAVNTIIAGVLALMKGNGLPERLGKDKVEFSRLQDWIEETEALLAVGVIGRNRKEVGLLVEVAFKKYNAAKASVVNNKPENYIRQIADGGDGRPGSSSGSGSGSESDGTTGIAMVNLRR